ACIRGGEGHAAEFVVRCSECVPLRGGRQRQGRSRQPLGQRRDQRVLLDAALQLPDAEAGEDRDHHQGEDAEAEARLSRALHFGARPVSRPSAALWWNCSAINSDLIARSGHSVTASVSGSHSIACTQSGGSNFTSVINAAVTTIAPAIMITNTAGPSPESMKA